MKHLALLAAAFALLFGAALPAAAQLSPNGSGAASGFNNPNQLQPKRSAPDLAPPGLPGGSAPVLATGPNLQKPGTGDPTAQLFTAVNNADYNSAQDAVSRGADINAQNNFGETPLDLSIALNHNSITFMLLSARNEGGEAPPSNVVTATTLPAHAPSHKLHATPARMLTPIHQAAPVNDPGTPNPDAGFLGFNPTK
jgi:ankyrin repeat protein